MQKITRVKKVTQNSPMQHVQFKRKVVLLWAGLSTDLSFKQYLTPNSWFRVWQAFFVVVCFDKGVFRVRHFYFHSHLFKEMSKQVVSKTYD